LFDEADQEKRIAAYRDIAVRATEEGAVIPLLQSVMTVGHKQGLDYTAYGNGWLLASKMNWT
jgi:ABC-type transport system substrate-binding protein